MKNLIFKSSFHEKLKMLLIAIGLLVVGLNPVWAGTGHSLNYPYFYYYKNTSTWSDVQVIVGRGWDNWNYTKVYPMGKSDNVENLYYVEIGDYWNDDYNQIAILTGASSWGTENNNIGSRWGYASGHSDNTIWNYDMNYHNTYYWGGKSASSIATSVPTYKTTLNIKVKESGGSYGNGSTSDKPATTIKLTGTYADGSGDWGTKRSDATWSSGSSCEYNTVISGKVTPSYSSKNDDWQFDGWYIGSTNKGSGTSFDFYQTSATTVEARFTRIKYTVNFDQQSGSGGTTSIKATYGSAMPSIALPTRSGYDFQGYYTEADGGGTKYYNSDGSSAKNSDLNTKAGTTLYAYWTLHTYNITLNKNGGSKDGSATVVYLATSFATHTAPEKSGWSVEGYYTNDATPVKIIDANGNLLANKSGYTNSSSQWTKTSDATLYAHWKQTYSVTYYTNFPEGATTSGAAPTDANEYNSGASVTVLGVNTMSATGYSFNGWNTDPSGSGTARAAGSTFSISGNTALYAQWTENKRNVTISVSPAGAGTLNTTSASVGVATTTTVTATAQPGYRFTGWTATNCSVASTSSASTTLSGNGTSGSATLVAGFSRTYAYIEGRMTVTNAARNSATHVGSSEGGWSESSFNVAMDYDGTNHRFLRHTYKTPAELSATQSSENQWFSIARSNTSGSWSSKTTYHPSSNTDITTAGIGNKKAAQTSTTTYNYKFNSSVSNGYVILYFDQAGVWYELEHTLKYDGNGSTGGSAPASETYYNNGSSATASSSSGYTKTNYTFGGWNTSANIDGTPYAAGASITMTANTTLYTKWTRSITLNQNSATTDGSTSVTATYNCSTLPSITAPEKTGYTFGGWYTANDGSGYYVISTSGALQASKSGWTGTGGIFTCTANTATLYAKWTQTITLNYNSANHGSGSNKSATVILNKTALSSITHCTPATGYHLVGYYTDATGGTKVLKDDGTFAATNVTDYITLGKWTKAGATTLYAHYEPNTYTIAFDANDANYVGTATGTTASIAATYGTSYTLTANGFSREGYDFAGWTRNADGTGTSYTDQQTSVSNLTSTNGATVTLYAKWTPKTYTVNFNARGGSGLTPTSKTVTMGSAYGTLATVTPPAGYVLDGWYTSAGGGTKVTAETIVETASDHTLYAHYVDKAQVYFKNTLGWSEVWVTYDAYWDSGNPSKGTGNSGKTYHKMTQITGTDVYYDDIPDGLLSSWKGSIAFNSEQLGSTPTGNYDNFRRGQAVFRRDFNKYATMFVPTPNDPNAFTLNAGYGEDGTTYYSTDQNVDKSGESITNYRYKNGYWMRYNDIKSGYTLKGSWDSWASDTYLECATVGGTTYSMTKQLAANTTYQFLLYKHCDGSPTYSSTFTNTGTMTSSNCTNWTFSTDNTAVGSTTNAKITTTVAGEYTFVVTCGADGKLKMSVIYPLAVGDYRVRYSYTKGSAKTYYSEIIKGRANGKDTISIFIHSADSASSRVLKIEKCTTITSGSSSWNTSYATIDLPAKTAAGQTYDGKTTSGVYNFIISQNGSKAASGAFWKKYEGNYYIRTASADGGWDFYRERSDNQMTLSEYSMTQTLSAPYSHYYCRFISEAERSTTDISYAIATDYSPNISGTMVGDATIGGDNIKVLPASANVRFSWNEETNGLRRAYLKNAQTENARFLVLHGSDSKVLDATGSTISAKDDLQANELKFTDMGNWIYQVNLQAQPGAKVSLIANYNSADRYLIGGESSFLTIIDGTGSAKYEMIAVYDFKTNRLMIAWTPSGEVGQNLTNVDVLLVRYKQNAGTAITLGTGKSVTSKTVIGAIRFDYNDLVGHVANWNNNSRPLLKYFISFPFDVNVSDIFGLNSAYGDAYEIQTYDGAERARKGFFRGDGTTTFWRTLQPGEVMKANEGYCVIMDNDYLNNDIGHVWDNKVAGSSVYLYFPSAGSVGSIASSSKTIAIPERTCSIDRPFVSTQAGGRTVSHQNTDSHWNMMGIPIFANTTDGTLGGAFVTSGQDGDGTFKYFYAWNSDNNQFAINTASGYTFNSMHGYMVQYYGNVTFTGAHTNLPTSVARRAPEENHQIELQVLNSDEEVINRAYVELRENACDTFALNEDVYMWTTNEAVDIYTFAGNYDVSANVLSLNDQTIQVGVEVRKAGKYTFSMPSNFNGTATLIDTFTGTRTNLAVSDYEVQLEKGIDTERFLLELYIEKVTTSLENNGGNNMLKDGGVHKFIKDNQLYILKNGVIYDARGARVQ